MNKVLLFLTSLTALSLAAQPKVSQKILPVNTPRYELSQSPLRYAPLRHNAGGRPVAAPQALKAPAANALRSSQAPNVAINGFVAYSDNDPSTSAPIRSKGMYRIDANGFTNLNATDFSQDIDASYGGALAGDTYWCAYVWDSQTEEIGIVPFLQQWNTTPEWSLADANFCDYSILGHDWTYDPVSQRIYGLFTSGNHPILGILDTATRERTTIGELDRDFVSIAATDDGILYGIDFEAGQLWIINPVTAKTTFVGNTGITTAFTASACYDPYSGKILWTPTSVAGESALYAIDPVTATATKVMDFPAGEQVLGIYAVAPAPQPGLPEAPRDLTVLCENGAMDGLLSFNTPAANQDGSVYEWLDYHAAIDGTPLSEARTSYNAFTSIPFTVTEPGIHTFTVYVSNEKGDGPTATLRKYIGFGIPKAPQVEVTRQDNINHLSWSAVSETADGGYIDPAAVTYTVVRQPGNVAVAETITATTLDDEVEAENEFSYFYYEVTANCGGRSSESGVSNRLDSGHITPPYLQTFDNNESLKGFTILNCNNDDKLWIIDDHAAYLKYNGQMASDDWLITPPVVLEAGKMYRISADVKGKSARYEEKFSIWAGTEPTPAGMTIPVVEETVIESDTYTDYGEYISVPSTGLYFIGVHGNSDKNKYALYVDNLSVSAPTSLEAPGAPTDIAAIPSPDGSASATISLKAPSVNLGGEPLSEITKLTVSRGGTEIRTFDNPQPGASLSFQDSSAEEGEFSYSAVAENSLGTGKTISFKIYLGVNVPGKPRNILAAETKPGTVCVSWDAPTIDADGYPINADLMTYTLYRPNEDGRMVVLEKDLTETSYTYMARPTSVEQAFETYGVQAKTRRGASPIMNSQTIPVGAPYTLPYIESYKAGYAHHVAAVQVFTGGEWNIYDDSTLAGLASVDSDGGFIAMYSNIATETSMLHTGKIDLAGAEKPVLTFYTFNIIARDPETGEIVGAIDKNKLEVLVNDRTNGFQTVKALTMDELPAEGWNRLSIDLSAYKGKVIELGFAATTDNKQYTLLDDIRLFDQLPHNLTAVSLAVPSKVQPNNPFDVTVTVENNGENPSQPYTVELSRNGNIVQSLDGPQLESGQHALVVFNETLNVTEDDTHEYVASINYSPDNLPDDNVSRKVTVQLAHSKVPVPTGLTGSADCSKVSLFWNEPDLNVVVADEVTDDFESYEPFAQDNVGDWTFIDNDGLPIGNMNSLGLPGITEDVTLSWFVNDASFAGWNGSISANSGNKFLATVFSKGGANDDWIISPRLAGTAQTITFYARSYNSRYLEAMEMLYSMTDTDLTSFTRVKEIPNVSSTWKLYSFDIPEGAEYFAIRCVSDDCAMLFVDDITYAPYKEAILDVDGYNIYRDGVRVNDNPADETAYVDNVILEDVARTYTYAVSALYGQTESRASQPVTVAVESGVDAIASASMTISATQGLITITGASGQLLEIFDPSGRTIHRSTPSGTLSIPVSPGVYLVKAGNRLSKLLVP